MRGTNGDRGFRGGKRHSGQWCEKETFSGTFFEQSTERFIGH